VAIRRGRTRYGQAAWSTKTLRCYAAWHFREATPSHGSGPSVSRVMGQRRRYRALQTSHSPETSVSGLSVRRTPRSFRASATADGGTGDEPGQDQAPATRSGRSAPVVSNIASTNRSNELCRDGRGAFVPRNCSPELKLCWSTHGEAATGKERGWGDLAKMCGLSTTEHKGARDHRVLT
jgi:hypothetical protein